MGVVARVGYGGVGCGPISIGIETDEWAYK